MTKTNIPYPELPTYCVFTILLVIYSLYITEQKPLNTPLSSLINLVLQMHLLTSWIPCTFLTHDSPSLTPFPCTVVQNYAPHISNHALWFIITVPCRRKARLLSERGKRSHAYHRFIATTDVTRTTRTDTS